MERIAISKYLFAAILQIYWFTTGENTSDYNECMALDGTKAVALRGGRCVRWWDDLSPGDRKQPDVIDICTSRGGQLFNVLSQHDRIKGQELLQKNNLSEVGLGGYKSYIEKNFQLTKFQLRINATTNLPMDFSYIFLRDSQTTVNPDGNNKRGLCLLDDGKLRFRAFYIGFLGAVDHHVVCEYVKNTDRHLLSAGYKRTHQEKKINFPSVKTITGVLNVLECGHHCLTLPYCLGFHLCKEASGTFSCQLLAVTTEDTSLFTTISMNQCDHYDKIA